FVIGVLPQFNLFSSTRPWGEGLGRAARNGVRLVAFGFPEPETLSPFMFYAGQRILAVNPGREVEALLAKGAVCVLVRRDAYARLGPSVRELPSTFGMAGGLCFVLVSACIGECPEVDLTRPVKLGASAKPRSQGEVFRTIAQHVGIHRRDVAAVFHVMGSLIKADLSRSGSGVFKVPGLMRITVKRKPATKERQGI